ncbi:MAG: aldose 1-epimerase family protein [Thermoguttaceae bacterium]|nr:aldose 1-epimerase family protein [Thermoguttaceae bacterium]
MDTRNNVYIDSLVISDSFNGFDIEISKERLHGGLQDGVDVLKVNTGRLSFTVLITRGMNIQELKCDDVSLQWNSPVQGPVHPSYVPIWASGGCGWLEGFSEWIARCGLGSNGAPEFTDNGVLKYPLHGRLSNLPARKVEVVVDSQGVVLICGEVLEASVFGHSFLLKVLYRVEAGSSVLQVQDSVVNLSPNDDEFELLYHINTGKPFLSAGARFHAAYHRMCPRDVHATNELDQWDSYREPITGCNETCYFFDLVSDSQGLTSVVLNNSGEDRGVALTFPKTAFPCFTLWKTQRPDNDIYVTGLEPATNYPNTRSFEKKNGRVVALAAGEERVFKFEVNVLTDKVAVRDAIRAIEKLQGRVEPIIEREPIATWCE